MLFLDLGKVGKVQVTVSNSENPPGSGPDQRRGWHQVWCTAGGLAGVNGAENGTE